jgi:hypothetical protein
LLRKYLPGINYEGFKSVFTPPIIVGVTFNATSDTIEVFSYKDYMGFLTTIVRKGDEYKVVESSAEGDF